MRNLSKKLPGINSAKKSLVCLNQNPQNYRMNQINFHPHSENSKILIQTLSSVTAQTDAPNAPYACYYLGFSSIQLAS